MPAPDFASAEQLAALLSSGTVDAGELARDALERIAATDRELNAFRLVFAEEARAEAEQADARLATGQRAPLLGVPIVVKEDQPLAGLPTTTGTDAVTTTATEDSPVVRRLRDAGTVILGRTRMPELGIWPFTETAFAGATRNPWSTTHSPGGSSGGTAAAIAAGIVPAGIGSDGGGSIRIPAAATNLFGLKPQAGRIHWHRDAQDWTGLATPGPLARTVLDAALLMDVLAPGADFAAAARHEPAALRVAVSTAPWPLGVTVHPDVRHAVTDTAELLRGLGHQVLPRDPDLPDRTLVRSFGPRYLASVAAAVAALPHPERLERRTRHVAALGRIFPDRAVQAAIRYSATVRSRVNAIFDDVDVLLTPVLPRPPLRIGEWQGHGAARTLHDSQSFTAFTTLWNLAGNPAASVPAGFTADGLPLAVQVIGRPHDDTTVLALSGQLERARPWHQRRPPL